MDSRLARRLTTFDAVVIGLGSMIGAGVFAAIGPAARAAGSGILVALVVAGAVAYCNATSSAQLAALYPESGGTYVYGTRQLGHFWGYLAGWGFVVGKTASCAAMALTFGAYAAPAHARPAGIAAVVCLTAVNYFGVKKTALVTKAVVVVVVASLAVVVYACLAGGQVDAGHLRPLGGTGGIYGSLQAAGLLFFAFAGYARIATLGEEVIDPQRTIPRAIPIALFITLGIYGSVTLSALLVLGPEALATATAPLEAAVRSGPHAGLAPLVRIGAAVASLGVLLSLIVGVSRTMFAMAAQRDLPAGLSSVHPRYRVPHRAELVVGMLVTALVSLVDLRGAIGFSSFAVLVYYAITNASILNASARRSRRPAGIAIAGLAGCVVLAFSLPLPSVAWGTGVLVAGALAYRLRPRR